jgi:hypothetical protein
MDLYISISMRGIKEMAVQIPKSSTLSGIVLIILFPNGE